MDYCGRDDGIGSFEIGVDDVGNHTYGYGFGAWGYSGFINIHMGSDATTTQLEF